MSIKVNRLTDTFLIIAKHQMNERHNIVRKNFVRRMERERERGIQ